MPERGEMQEIRESLLVHVGEPVAVLRVLTFGGREERGLEFLRDRTTVSLPHGAVVDLTDRRELGSRAREEALVGEL